MQIEIHRDVLVQALGLVGGVVERRQTLPILGNLLLRTETEQLILTATDLELQISTRVAATVREEGAITLPAKKFADICRAAAENNLIKLTLESERAIIRAGRSRFALSTLPAADYPTMENSLKDFEFQIEQGVIKKLLDKSAFAMAQQDVRYYLNGLLLELKTGQMTAVGTDGHRLAKVDAETEELKDLADKRQLIVPAKSVTELKRLLSPNGENIRMYIGERSLAVRIGETLLMTKLIDGRYPEYERVIPNRLERHALVNRDALRASLQRTAILSNDKFKGVRVTFDKGVLRLELNNPEREEAEDEVEIDYDGDTTMIGFNVAYLLDVLNAVDGRNVRVSFTDSSSSAIWGDVDFDKAIYVVMPMRL